MKDTFKFLIRKLTIFAWSEMLFDVSRVEYKYGRKNDGTPLNWTEWDNVRNHLKEVNALRQPQELEKKPQHKLTTD